MNKAIFWDFDGTLVHANQNFLLSFKNALEAFGCFPGTEALTKVLQDACPWHHPERDYTRCTGENWWPAMYERLRPFCMDHGIAERGFEDVCSSFRNGVINYPYTIYDDAISTLKDFKALGFRSYLLSNNYPELEAVIGRLGLASFFSGLIISGQAGFEKPRQELFAHAMRIAGSPDFACMVGDNPAADVGGAERMGWTGILVHAQGDVKHRCDALAEVRSVLSV